MLFTLTGLPGKLLMVGNDISRNGGPVFPTPSNEHQADLGQ